MTSSTVFLKGEIGFDQSAFVSIERTLLVEKSSPNVLITITVTPLKVIPVHTLNGNVCTDIVPMSSFDASRDSA